MAEPTLKDILAAVAQLRSEMKEMRSETKEMRSDMNEMRSEMSEMRSQVNARFDKVEADVNAHRAETAAGFAKLERELEAHAEGAHRDLDEDISAIHKGLVRAKVAGIPKELPSQVRAKGERASKPAKRSARRR